MDEQQGLTVPGRVREAFCSVLGADAFAGGAVPRLGGHPRWDSLGHIDLVLAVERACGVAFSGHEMPSLDTFDRMVEAVQRKLAGSTRPVRES